MWTAIAKCLFRTKVHPACSRTLLQAQKGKCLHQNFSGSSRLWQRSSGRAQAVEAFSMNAAIQTVEALDANQYICVHWEDGSKSLYPSVWLRDNCQCPDCFLHSAKARKLLLENLDVNIGAKNVMLLERQKVLFWVRGFLRNNKPLFSL